MSRQGILRAALTGLTLAVAAIPPGAFAQNLTVLSGTIQEPIDVPLNRAVVVESDIPFTELSIANPGIADISSLSDRTIYVLGKAPGRTTLTLLGVNGELIANVEVRVSPDVAEFKERLEQILPGQGIEVRTANDGIVLSGTVDSIADLDRALELANRYAPERVSNLMTVGGTQQVMLQVRFAEMNRSVSKALGTSLIAQGVTLGGDLGVSAGTGNLLTPDAQEGFGGDGGVPLSAGSQGAVLLGFNAGGLEVGILLEALERRGMVRTLAEPNLTALSGQEANFLAGGEYPVPVSQGDGEVTVEFKSFGVELNFVPRVLELSAAVSSLDPSAGVSGGGFDVSGFRRRETSTTVEMRDGESFAIAGLLQDDFRDVSSQVPFLGDIPVLGALFRSADYARNQSELVIIVTPHLVTPTRGEALALPTDRVRPPTERDLFLFGRVAASEAPRSGGAGEVARQDFSGSYGYVMD
jgi:pilus assembly protein CpaC